MENIIQKILRVKRKIIQCVTASGGSEIKILLSYWFSLIFQQRFIYFYYFYPEFTFYNVAVYNVAVQLYIQAQFVKEEKVKLVGKNDRLVQRVQNKVTNLSIYSLVTSRLIIDLPQASQGESLNYLHVNIGQLLYLYLIAYWLLIS